MKRSASKADYFGEGDDDQRNMYNRHQSTLFDEDDMIDGMISVDSPTLAGEKKRRLSSDQVRALEKSFEVENKLEPERKAKLALELGLQPRQVAVWFQNRRARWKTKQLEHDYSALRSRYESLKQDYDSLHLDKQNLLSEIKALKAKLGVEESVSISVKEEPGASTESDNKASVVINDLASAGTLIYKEIGSSESDSSAVLNDDNCPSSLVLQMHCNNHSSNNQQSSQELETTMGLLYQPQLLKFEESNNDDDFLGGDDEPCSSFFVDEQPPTLPWYCSDDQWS